jgi:hypothetical protein
MRAALVGSLVLWLAGCAFDEHDLRNWQHVQGGDRKLAGYLADSKRDLGLRVLAGSILLESGAIPQIVSVVKDAPADDRHALLPGLAARVALVVEGADFPIDQQATAVDLGYFLLQYAGDLEPARADKLAVTLAQWAAAHTVDEKRPTQRPLEYVMLAAAVARPEAVVPVLLDQLRQAQQLPPLVLVARVLIHLKDADALRRSAGILLEHARKRFPEIPVALAETMVANGNETLLRFLLEAARDPRVPMAVRATALNDAVDGLGRKALPGLLRIVGTDDPAHGNDPRWHALDRIWELNGVASLRDELRALPPGGTWPNDGATLRSDVDLFCDSRVGQQKAAALPVLTGLLKDESWVARAFAMECIVRLFPDDAPRLLAGLRDDDTPLPGWSADGQPATVGAVVRRLAADR